MHNGVKETLTDLRSRFWVVRGRQTVRDVISPCATCKKLEGRSYNAPPQAPLPDFRVSDEFAFTQVGVDFGGPVYLRDVFSKSKKVFKAYIALLPDQRQLLNELTKSVEKERKHKQTRDCAAIIMKLVIDRSRYEQWLTLIRVTAFVLRGVQAFKSGPSAGSKELSVEQLQDAKLSWYRQLHQGVYQAEYGRLKEDLPLSNTSAILKLDPFYDKRDHLLRVGGRLEHSDLPEGTKHPIILPHGHAVVEKIIQSVHKELLHAGPESTLSVLRQEIWLTKGRREIKRVLGKCFVCQRQRVIAIGEGVIVSRRHSRRYRLCRAIIRTRKCLLSEGLHLHLHALVPLPAWLS